MAKICGWFGVTRQAYYQYNWRTIDTSTEADLVLKEVCKIRLKHKRMGGRKLHDKLVLFMLDHQIKMGRDAFFNLLSNEGLLVRKRKIKTRTTNSHHWLRKYDNLIKNKVLSTPNQLWVSDITYWKINNQFVYINLITDAYSHKIVGNSLSKTLESLATIQALEMALSDNENQLNELIHHSDRGVQYCSHKYVETLVKNGVQISMTETGDPRDNAIAERLNGILKDEYLLNYNPSNYAEALEILNESINLYNNDRQHMSISNQYPNDVHQKINTVEPKRLWKNYWEDIDQGEQKSFP